MSLPEGLKDPSGFSGVDRNHADLLSRKCLSGTARRIGAASTHASKNREEQDTFAYAVENSRSRSGYRPEKRLVSQAAEDR